MASETQKKSTRQRSPKPAAEEKRNGQVAVPEVTTYEVSFTTYAADAYGHEELGLTPEQLLEMYENMMLQRRFEERAAQMYGKQKIAGFLHLYIGQEAVSTGAAFALNIGQDSVITAYRDHGIGLALGMSPNACMAELFGKIDGCSRGKGGSMHYFSKELGMFGGHGIVGGHIPVGTGIAFAHKYKGDGGVCLTFFGDGAVGQGSWHEAANLASLYKLPVVFIIENNQYAMGTATHRAFAEPDFYKQAVPYNLPAAVVNGMDVLAVYKAMKDHVALARDNQPSLLEVRTYRYRGHSMSDPAKYRTKEELEQKKNDDPILRLKGYLLNHGMADNDQLDAIDERVKQIVMESVEFAENSPLPPLETIYEDVYVQKDYPFIS
ncbi:MAG: pyruvate dehydrogenase (acetyl-transferring) E1 component subunit alpha [Bacteroidetes bacterium]|nr:pyruvate dehydrogenase (acetyl-transferring) E1 component subunit alpha [Rhodothermaceae bacterium RA]RMH63859.1 MAG: pyruvate dehydrogenase (acetyl-transferring) E1 component subunit alpha [Bacteroidota bacterium]